MGLWERVMSYELRIEEFLNSKLITQNSKLITFFIPLAPLYYTCEVAFGAGGHKDKG
jgi:hypothetical protein